MGGGSSDILRLVTEDLQDGEDVPLNLSLLRSRNQIIVSCLAKIVPSGNFGRILNPDYETGLLLKLFKKIVTQVYKRMDRVLT